MKHVLAITKALSDRNRLRILTALNTAGELCACQITELLQVTGATVSRHLTIMTHAGLLESRKSGRWIFYRIRNKHKRGPVLKWLIKELSDVPDVLDDQRSIAHIIACDPEDICRKQRGEKCCPIKKNKTT